MADPDHLGLPQTAEGICVTTSEYFDHEKLLELGIYGAEDLAGLAQTKTEYIVDGLLPTGSIAILVGDSGLGKTPLSITLGISVAAGGQFLKRSTVQGRVLYCDTETPTRSNRSPDRVLGW